uniref:RING-type domain-containing protein n=1 Tax=Macrostomum lignano TaxID=282301 RepID=A0A1I8HUB4_9PLAT
WQCPHCTFINDGAQGRQLHRRLICLMCGKSTDFSELKTSAECPVCTDDKKLVEVPLCGCEVCSDCLCQQIEVRLMNDSSVSVLTCPVCDKLDDRALTDTSCEYFPLLRRLLAGQLKPAVMKKLDERLRDWRLKLTDNFCWCSGCSNGFEVSEHHDRQVRCPHCGKETCRKCGKAWHERHRGVSCQQFGEWRQQTDLSERGLAQFLESRGSSCPKCGFQFELSRGGCLHLTCRQCKTEFCSDCGSLFVRQECCGGNKGLHCHHGSECVETFRDWPLEKVRQTALERGVQLELVGVAGAGGRCSVQEQKETSGGGLEDGKCGRPVVESGLCESHLKEALASAMRGDNKKPRVGVANVASSRRKQTSGATGAGSSQKTNPGSRRKPRNHLSIGGKDWTVATVGKEAKFTLTDTKGVDRGQPFFRLVPEGVESDGAQVPVRFRIEASEGKVKYLCSFTPKMPGVHLLTFGFGNVTMGRSYRVEVRDLAATDGAVDADRHQGKAYSQRRTRLELLSSTGLPTLH